MLATARHRGWLFSADRRREMTCWVQRIVALALGLSLAGDVRAGSPEPADFDARGLLLNESVQKELNLSEQQVKKLNQAFTQVWQKLRPKFLALRKLPAAG